MESDNSWNNEIIEQERMNPNYYWHYFGSVAGQLLIYKLSVS